MAFGGVETPSTTTRSRVKGRSDALAEARDGGGNGAGERCRYGQSGVLGAHLTPTGREPADAPVAGVEPAAAIRGASRGGPCSASGLEAQHRQLPRDRLPELRQLAHDRQERPAPRAHQRVLPH